MKSILVVLGSIICFYCGYIISNPMKRIESGGMLRTAERLLLLECMIREYARINGQVPETLDALAEFTPIELDLLKDGWGCEIFYKRKDFYECSVYSLGPLSDAIRLGFNNADGLNYLVSKSIDIRDEK